MGFVLKISFFQIIWFAILMNDRLGRLLMLTYV